MKKLFNNILRPGWRILTVFGVLSLITIVYYMWQLSFYWEFPFSFDFRIRALLILLCILFLAAFFLDRKFPTNLKRYFIIVILQLVIIWPLAEPVQNWHIDRAIEKSEDTIFAIDSYKEQFSVYPPNLSVLNENLSANISFKTGFGTEFEYKLMDSNKYTLNFISYKGYTAYYNQELKEWVFRD